MASVPQVEFDIAYLFKIDVIGDIHNQLTQTSFHFSARGAMLSEEPITIGASLIQHFEGAALSFYKLCCAQEWICRTLILTSMIPKSEVLIERPQSSGQGGQDGVSLPSFNAVLLRLRTGYGGRSRTGAIHLPAPAKDLVNGSRVDDSYLITYRNFRDVLLSAYGVQGSSNSFLYGLYSRKLGNTQPGGPGTPIHHSLTGFYPITSIFVDPEVGTIRKRKLGHGE